MSEINQTNEPRPDAFTIAVSPCTLFNMAHQVEHENEHLEPGPAFPFVKDAFTIAVSLCTLFNMAHQVEHENEHLEPGPAFPFVKDAFTIAVSSCTLFNMAHQVEHENEHLEPGPAFPFVKALMHVNSRLRELYPDSEELFDIVLMTNNHAQDGERLMNSIKYYNLTIERFCMTGGESPIGYLKAYMTNLYLSEDSKKVTEAIEEGIAAATMFMPEKENELSDTQLRVAFDGDGVIFSDESEIITKTKGLDAFFEHEKNFENKFLPEGPLKCFLEALCKLQRKFKQSSSCPIRTFLVTSRGDGSPKNRVLKTLRSWGLEIDEPLFLAGAPKGPLLQEIKPHIFFDDQMFHIEGAKELGTISAHVPYGIAQKYHGGN